MTWAAPAYLGLGWLAVPLLFLALWSARRRRRGFASLTGTRDTPLFARGRGTDIARGGLLSLAAALLVIACCRPQWGEVAEEHQSEGVDILVALDTSRSMLADDLSPTRLSAAKQAVTALTAKLQGDRIGLIAFAGSAFVVCPLTADYGVFSGALDETGVDTIPLGGTSLAAALKEAREVFSRSVKGGKVLIVVSDGEDQGGGVPGEYQAQVKGLHDAGVAVYSVAAGTRQGGLIPLAQGDFLKDRRGAVVKSRLQPALLQELATAGGGRLIELAGAPTALAELYRHELAGLERKAQRGVRARLRERFGIPLALALALLSLELCLGLRREQ
jgi:Ca-activated chloride channel homolog